MPKAEEVVRIYGQEQDFHMNDNLEGHVTMHSLDLFNGHLFGGQVFSQAMNACQLWLSHQKSSLKIHMTHGVFLKAGTPYEPLEYKVTPLGLGRTFQRFQVQAYQKGTLIFQSMVSAQRPEEPYIQHQQNMPEAPLPETLMTDEQLKRKITGQDGPQSERPIQIRVATPEYYLKAYPAESHHGFWFRYAFNDESEAQSLRPEQQRVMLAYASDYGFLGGLFVPQDISIRQSSYFLTSLDHSLWYYGDYKSHEWAYFEIESPVADHGRGSVYGRIYQQGKLVAVASQEGLLRRREKI